MSRSRRSLARVRTSSLSLLIKASVADQSKSMTAAFSSMRGFFNVRIGLDLAQFVNPNQTLSKVARYGT
ncbi:MAG: hypothetical protein DWH73_00880 [Planctomycetota bacterium]|nr:MAG: hypothetical protein DWH73_00880 [Planctomycetota bacterium]